MSRKLLISWCLTPIFCLIVFSIFAREEQVETSSYYFFHQRKHNFSSTAWIPSGKIALFSENQFLLKELCSAYLSMNYCLKGNAVAMQMEHFGYLKYGILTLSAGYAREFAQRVTFGLQVHYMMHHVEAYSKTHSFTFDLSIFGKISSKIGIGIAVYNPANLKYGLIGKEKIPMRCYLTINYQVNEKLILAVGASKHLPGFFDVNGTVCFKNKFVGFFTEISLKQMGILFSFWWKKLQFDLGGSFNYRLGFSPSAGISYPLNSIKKIPANNP